MYSYCSQLQASVSDPEQRKLAMAELLSSETKALQGLQKLKHSAAQELQVEKTQQMLERMSMPHVWQLSKGEAAQVFTPETQRAKELLDLFNALNAPLLSTDQRLDVLLNVKVCTTLRQCSIVYVLIQSILWHYACKSGLLYLTDFSTWTLL